MLGRHYDFTARPAPVATHSLTCGLKQQMVDLLETVDLIYRVSLAVLQEGTSQRDHSSKESL